MSIESEVKKKILEITYKYKQVHLSSTLSSVEPLIDIFRKKKRHEKFVLSNGHAGIALYAVLEKFYGADAEALYKTNYIHPNRGPYIDCSTGSLGHGISIALGMALSDRNKNVYCLLSDGEMAEGSVWEALRIMSEQKVYNLKLYFNFNGYSALGTTDIEVLVKRINTFIDPEFTYKFVDCVNIYYTDNGYSFLKGVSGHYHRITSEEYESAMYGFAGKVGMGKKI